MDSINPADNKNHKDSSPLNVERYEGPGDFQPQQGSAEKALIQHDKALPENLRTRYETGVSLLKGRLADEALKEFEEILDVDSSYALAYEGMGQALMQMGRYDEAEEDFRRAIELDSNLWLSHNFLGMICDRRLSFDEAITHYKRAIALKSDEDLLFNNLGMSYYLKGDYQKSAEMLRKATKVKPSVPKNPKIYNNLGLVLGKLGRYREALDAFEKAGDRAAAHNNLGCIYLKQGRYSEAIAAFEKAIEIKPTFYKKANENLKRAKKAQEKRKGLVTNLRAPEEENEWKVLKPSLPVKEKKETLKKEVYDIPPSVWVVEVCSSLRYNVAANLAGRVKDQEFPVYIYCIDLKGQKWYRVSVGPYSTKEEAQEVKERIVKKFGITDSWVHLLYCTPDKIRLSWKHSVNRGNKGADLHP